MHPKASQKPAENRLVLVANRGEIAARILRTCRRLGLRTLAIRSEADAAAAYLGLADEVTTLGALSDPSAGYLDIERIVQTAREGGVSDVHPGFGFLAENPAFARAVREAGMRFVGPSAEAMEQLGSKIACRSLLESLGIPTIPGVVGQLGVAPDSEAEEEDTEKLMAQAAGLQLPLMVKASAGGGGKGMRNVESADGLEDAIRVCRREAFAAFGDGGLMVEQRVEQARHVEVQLIADELGSVIPLLDRDCSIQRRHQKVLEECPAPGLAPELRQGMAAAAVEVARAVGYVGAGTVEFLVTSDEQFYFLEMNTRLQVEHTVTEEVLGLDLVELQLAVAVGEALPADLASRPPRGHAVQVRLYAEDPRRDFVPSPGRLDALVLPRGPGIRVDAGVGSGDEVSAHYDPMLAKVVAWGEDRDAALDRLATALAETHVLGVRTNLELLAWLCAWPALRSGGVHTGLLEEVISSWKEAPEREPSEEELLAAAALLWLHGTGWAVSPGEGSEGVELTPGPWESLGGWRSGGGGSL